MKCVIPSQSHILSLFLMPVIQCIVAQWRHVSSESAVLIYEYLLPNVMPNRRHGIFYFYQYLWQEICAINAQVATRTKQQLK